MPVEHGVPIADPANAERGFSIINQAEDDRSEGRNKENLTQ